MDRQTIIQTVGPELYWATSRAAQLAAPYCGKDDPKARFDSDVPHEINNLIWDSALDDTAKLCLMFEIYQDMPCYGLLMYANINFRDLSGSAQDQLWQQIRFLLTQNDEGLAGPVAYLLWCDFFEDHRQVTESWNTLVTDTSSPRLLERILEVSGPVPFALKERLYKRLIGDRAWHSAIYRSLLFSNYDVYGQIDQQKARRLLEQLDLPPELRKSKELTALRAALSTPADRISA